MKRLLPIATASIIVAAVLAVQSVAAPARRADRAVKLTKVVDGLDSPLYVTQPAGDPRLFVVEQTGRIRVVKDGSLASEAFANLSGELTSGGERGLLSVAFHPRFAENGLLYVDFTDHHGDTRVVELHAKPGSAQIDSRRRVLLKVKQPFDNHNGGQLQFGPDGYLYIGMGDGGSGGDPQGNGQKPSTLLGKLLRIDVDHRSGGRQYGVPATNPFRTRPGWRSEIYSLGLRNPWRFSFDSKRGDLWIGDVGQNEWEEIDHVGKGRGRGANFGWNRLEGSHRFSSGGFSGGRLQGPVAEYRHSDGGCSVTGGYVYRGPSIPRIDGRYVFADYCSGQVWSLSTAGGAPRPETKSADVTSFGEDSDHRLYLCSDGALYRFDSA